MKSYSDWLKRKEVFEEPIMKMKERRTDGGQGVNQVKMSSKEGGVWNSIETTAEEEASLKGYKHDGSGGIKH